jgi:hypothetical protein
MWYRFPSRGHHIWSYASWKGSHTEQFASTSSKLLSFGGVVQRGLGAGLTQVVASSGVVAASMVAPVRSMLDLT